MATVPEIEQLSIAVNATEEWIDDLMRRLGWRDRSKVYVVLLATLHALRDAVARDEAIYVGAQFPALLRGLYYEGWHPGARPAARSRTAFLERIHDGAHRDPGVDAEEVAGLYSPCSRRVCLRPSSRMPRPPRHSRCTIYGQAEAMLSS